MLLMWAIMPHLAATVHSHSWRWCLLIAMIGYAVSLRLLRCTVWSACTVDSRIT